MLLRDETRRTRTIPLNWSPLVIRNHEECRNWVLLAKHHCLWLKFALSCRADVCIFLSVSSLPEPGFTFSLQFRFQLNITGLGVGMSLCLHEISSTLASMPFVCCCLSLHCCEYKWRGCVFVSPLRRALHCWDCRLHPSFLCVPSKRT